MLQQTNHQSDDVRPIAQCLHSIRVLLKIPVDTCVTLQVFRDREEPCTCICYSSNYGHNYCYDYYRRARRAGDSLARMRCAAERCRVSASRSISGDSRRVSLKRWANKCYPPHPPTFEAQSFLTSGRWQNTEPASRHLDPIRQCS